MPLGFHYVICAPCVCQARLLRYFALYRRFYTLVTPEPQVLDRALDLADRFNLSHWDSMLLAACVEAGVDTLYTEDMGFATATR